MRAILARYRAYRSARLWAHCHRMHNPAVLNRTPKDS